MDQQTQSEKKLLNSGILQAVGQVYRWSEDIQRYMDVEQDTSQSLRREAVCGKSARTVLRGVSTFDNERS